MEINSVEIGKGFTSVVAAEIEKAGHAAAIVEPMF